MNIDTLAILAPTAIGFMLLLGRLNKLDLKVAELKSVIHGFRDAERLQAVLSDLKDLRSSVRVFYHEAYYGLPLELQDHLEDDHGKQRRKWKRRNKDTNSSLVLRRSIGSLEVSLSTISNILDSDSVKMVSQLIDQALRLVRQVDSWLEVSGDTASEAIRDLGMNYQITEERYPFHDKEKLAQQFELLFEKAEYRLSARVGETK